MADLSTMVWLTGRDRSSQGVGISPLSTGIQEPCVTMVMEEQLKSVWKRNLYIETSYFDC